ncbi:hypothetical protein ACTXT7_006995 [Hymenolepis weldensis]
MLQRQMQEKYVIYEPSDQLQLKTYDLSEPLDLSLPKVTVKNELSIRNGDKLQNEEQLLNPTGVALECFPRKSFTVSALLSDRASPLNDPNDQSKATLIRKISVDTTWRKRIGNLEYLAIGNEWEGKEEGEIGRREEAPVLGEDYPDYEEQGAIIQLISVVTHIKL